MFPSNFFVHTPQSVDCFLFFFPSHLDPIAKIAITEKDRVIAKLRTKKKSCSSSPIFNEAISCPADKSNISDIQIIVTIVNDKKHGKHRELGRIVLSSKATGNELRHWNDALCSPDKHIAEWHDLVHTRI